MRHTKNFEIMMPLNAGGYLVWVLVTLKSQILESLITVQHLENSVFILLAIKENLNAQLFDLSEKLGNINVRLLDM